MSTTADKAYNLREAFHVSREEAGLASLRAMLRYCPQFPTRQQQTFLDIECREALFAGQSGSSKSSTLGMAALQYVDVPGYRALLLRVNKADFFLSSGLGERMKGWVFRTDARFINDSIYFPNGSLIEFGHVKTRSDMERYLSREYSFLGFEELTTFNLPDDPEVINPYLWLNRSLRQPVGFPVPPRIRATTNPGGRSHAMVKRRFVTDAMMKEIRETQTRRVFQITPDRAYLHGYAHDNKHINVESYHKGLDNLDTVSRARQKFGDWAIQDGSEISVSWFRYYKRDGDTFYLLDKDRERVVAQFELDESHVFATIDAAGTSEAKAQAAKGNRSSYSAIGVWLKPPARIGKFLLCLHVTRKRLSIPELRNTLVKINREWRPARLGVENEKFGQSLTQITEHTIPIKEISHRGKDKKERATPLIDAMERGAVFFPHIEPNWFKPYTEELATWTGTKTEIADQLDMSAYAALEVFLAVPSLWDSRYFGIDYRYKTLPDMIDRLGIGIAPACNETNGVSAIVGVARKDGKLYLDGIVDTISAEAAIDSVNRVADLFPGIPPYCVFSDFEFKRLAMSKLPAMRTTGMTANLRNKKLPKDIEDIEQFLDPGIREGKLLYSLSEGGNAIVSRLSTYPESADSAAMRAIWLAARAIDSK